MEKFEKSITYVFTKRIELKDSQLDTPKEFEYSYNFIKNIYPQTRYVEAVKPTKKSLLLKAIDKFLNKLTKVSFNTKSYINFNNFKIFKKTDVIVTTNHGISSSVLFLVIFTRFFNKKLKLFLINSGFFNIPKNQKYIHFLRKLVVKLFLKTHTKILFTSLTEYEFALKNYSNYSKKFHYHSFCLDDRFWSKKSLINNPLKVENYILFVGNNGFRDVKMLLNIAEALPEYKFVFITKLLKNSEINQLENIHLLNGEIMDKVLTDNDLKKIYEDALITINPLKDSLVASGQSVTMQSMSVGTPVIISKTIGFWDNFNFKDNENIYFVSKNELNDWVIKVKNVLFDTESLEGAKKNSKELILYKFQQKYFDKFMYDMLLG